MLDDDDEADLRSRTELARERKVEEKRLGALSTTLVRLSSKQVGKLDLNEEILDAIGEARRMTTHAARARQLRVVRRELRGSDSLAIAAAVDDLLNPRAAPSPATRKAQRWLDRFLTEGNDAVESFLANHEHADRQRLKRLLRNASKADASKAAKARTTLMAAIQAVIQQAER